MLSVYVEDLDDVWCRPMRMMRMYGVPGGTGARHKSKGLRVSDDSSGDAAASSSLELSKLAHWFSYIHGSHLP